MLGRLEAGLAALGVVSLMATGAKADSNEMARTQLGHLAPRVLAPIEPSSPSDHPHRYEDRLAYRLPDALAKWADIDKTLTHLCERGAFSQQKPEALYAVAGGRSYGVAVAEGANLHDPQNRAKPGIVYFFGRADTTRCLVLSAPAAKLQGFRVNTISLIKPAP